VDQIKLSLFAAAAASSYLALLYKLCQVRRGWRDPMYLSLMATLVLQCLTFTIGAVSVSSPALFGVRNLTILLLHVVAVAMCVGARIVLLQWEAPLPAVRAKIRYWLIAGAAASCLLALLFFAGRAESKPVTALTIGTTDPVLLAYLLLFMASQAVPCVIIYGQCRRYARITDKPWLRRALRLLAVSAVVLLGYCAARTVNILSPVFHVSMGSWQLTASVLSAIGIAILSVGITMPSWGPQLAGLPEWTRNYASYRALYPLWRAVYDSSPGIALEPPRSSVTDMRYRLHRRVIEIRDGWRALRPYMDQHISDEGAAGPDGADDQARQAHLEALRIREAIRAKQSARVPVHSRDVAGFDSHDAATRMAEVSWLTQVAAEYTRLR